MSECAVGPVATTVVVALVVVLLVHDGTHDALTMRTLLTLLWPIVLLSLLDPSDRGNPAVVPATLWMGLVWWIDSYSLLHAPTSGGDRRTGMQFDSHTVTAMSFGLCGLVGARYDTKYTHLILYALMTCIMFVLPVHNLPSSDPFSHTVDEVQRMCLVYSIALLLSGVALTRATKAPST